MNECMYVCMWVDVWVCTPDRNDLKRGTVVVLDTVFWVQKVKVKGQV